MAVWIFFFSAAPTAQNSPELTIRFIDSYIQWSVVLYLGSHDAVNFLHKIVSRGTKIEVSYQNFMNLQAKITAPHYWCHKDFFWILWPSQKTSTFGLLWMTQTSQSLKCPAMAVVWIYFLLKSVLNILWGACTKWAPFFRKHHYYSGSGKVSSMQILPNEETVQCALFSGWA